MKKAFLILFSVIAAFASVSAAEPTVVFSEGFSAFTEGSEAEPSTTDISTPSYSNKLRNTLTGWSGKYVYEAGGMLKIGDGGNLTTASYSMSANSGVVKVFCRVRSLTDYGMMLKVSIGYSSSKQIVLEDGEWHDLEFVMAGGSYRSALKLEPTFAANGFLVDSLAVTQSEDYFPAPTANQPSVANGTSFVATWSRVTGTTAYLLDVYTKKSATDFDYVLKDEQVTTTNKTVNGLDASKTYYFRVRATNGTATSDYSDEIEVVKVLNSIDAPKAKAATNVTPTGFTANWEAVADAQSYMLNVFRTNTVETDGDVDLLTEDFSGVKIGTLESVEFGTLSGEINEYTHMPGWWVENPAFAAGYLVLSAYGSLPASLTTPYLDLSGNNGAFKAVINMAEMNYGTTYEGGEVTVALVNDEDSVIESKKVTLENGFKDYTVEFTKGGKNMAVQVSYSNTADKVFIDTFTLSQKLSAGESYTVFDQAIEGIEGLSYDVKLTTPMSDGKVAYSYDVQAVGRTVESGEIVDIYSEASNMVLVSMTTGVDQNVAAKTAVKAYRSGNAVVVEASEPVAVTVYSLSGAVVAKAAAAEGTTTIELNIKEPVIVKLGNKAVKL